MKRSDRLKRCPALEILEHRQLLAAPITEFPVPAGARAIAAGPGGNLWFTLANDQIGRITTDGQVTTFPIPASQGGPASITAGADGNLWFTYAADPGLGRLTPDGQYTAFAPNAEPDDVVTGADGNVWFVDGSNNTIGRVTPSGELTEFTVPTPNSFVYGITVGPDRNLWFTEIAGGKIGRMTYDGAITEFPIGAFSAPTDITTGADGNLWFTSDGGGIYRMTTTGQSTYFDLRLARQNAIGSSGSNPRFAEIVADPYGDVWFTEFGSNAIGRITPAGMISEFPIPTAASGPIGITYGPDGNIWFAESAGTKVGRFRVSTTDLAVTVSPRAASGTTGQSLTYTISITNYGPIEATDVVLTQDYLPNSALGPQLATTTSVTASQGSVRATPLLVNLGNLPSGATATVTVVAALTTPFSFKSRYIVLANESDRNRANDADTLSVTLGPTAPPQVLGLRSVRVKRKGLTAIVVHFDQPMNPGALQNPGIYHLKTAVKGKTSRAKTVRFSAASYDAASRSVTLSLKKPIKTSKLRLTIDHTSVVAASGLELSGGDYIAIVPK